MASLSAFGKTYVLVAVAYSVNPARTVSSSSPNPRAGRRSPRSITPTTMSEETLVVDKCAVCETYVVVGSVADLRRRMNAHELEAHGRIKPTRVDHGAADYR